MTNSFFIIRTASFRRMLITGLLTASLSAAAQDKIAEIDKIFAWATPATPGCSCGISRNGELLAVRAYGAADLEKGTPISDATVFDIGSTRKQFIAAAVLILAEEKRLALSDDVRKYIPELPDYGYKITIDNLLTHTSGIRDWTGLLPLAAGNPTAESMILRQRSLNFAPGDAWSYSNSGFVLLVDVVQRITKRPFAEFVQNRLFAPLNMTSTRYVSDMRQVTANGATGYTKEGAVWKPSVYLGNDRGGGAIVSTVLDLLTWNAALANKKPSAYVAAKLEEPVVLNNGRALGYGRGLALDPYRDTRMLWHSGAAAGYHTWLGRIPSQGLSIAVLCNSDAVAATSVASRLLSLYTTSPASAAGEDGPPPTLTGDDLSDINTYAGLYFNERTGEPIRLAVDRDRFRVAGGPGLAPVAKGRYRRWGNSVFFMSQDRFELNFGSPDRFELVSMEGTRTPYRRARPYAPAPIELNAFAGRYLSEELTATFFVTAGNGTLMIRANDPSGEALEFKPVDPDTFQLAGVTIRFEKDKNGQVTGLSYSNPLVTGIRFSKQPKE